MTTIFYPTAKNVAATGVLSSYFMMMLSALASPDTAQTLKVMPYYGELSHSDSLQKSGQKAYGTYVYYGRGLHSFELDGNTLRSKNAGNNSNNNSNNTPIDARQNEWTALYTNYQIPNIALRGGAHYIAAKADGVSTGHTSTQTVGVSHFSYGQKGAAAGQLTTKLDAEYDVTQYRENGAKTNAQQANLGVHRYYPSSMGTVHIGNTVSGVFLQKRPLDNQSASYFRNRVEASIQSGALQAGVYGNVGRAPFLVDKQGFVVSNSNELRGQSIGAELGYQLTLNSAAARAAGAAGASGGQLAPVLGAGIGIERTKIKGATSSEASGYSNKFMASVSAQF